MAVSGGDEFEAVCWQTVGQVIDVDDKQYQALKLKKAQKELANIYQKEQTEYI